MYQFVNNVLYASVNLPPSVNGHYPEKTYTECLVMSVTLSTVSGSVIPPKVNLATECESFSLVTS
jgi:hypothetical protein